MPRLASGTLPVLLDHATLLRLRAVARSPVSCALDRHLAFDEEPSRIELDPRAETRATLGCLLGSGQAAYFFAPALEPVLPFIEGVAAMVFCFSVSASWLPDCRAVRP